ncbi:hypothetical protein pipiens_011172 [Culex pipiens pipiens]|uniref:Endonuclease/exonuclease/phosphatase domain-containing protein n=1 Tax=Culex pipiens pipiens TaxID=38569 RepID=A0ABD1D7C3_CULPP
MFWMCDTCAANFANRIFPADTFRPAPAASGASDALSSLQADVSELKAAILSLTAKIDKQPSQRPTTPLKPRGFKNGSQLARTTKHRRNGTAVGGPVTYANCGREPNTLNVTMQTVEISDEGGDELLHLYLSAFEPTTSEDDVAQLVRDFLDMEDSPKVQKLVPKGKDLSTLSFVSFKNIRGMRTKTEKLRLALMSSDYDVVVLTETWLHGNILDSEFSAIYVRPRTTPDVYTLHAESVQQILEKATDQDVVVVVGDNKLPDLVWVFDEDVGGFLPANASSDAEVALTESFLANGLVQINFLLNNRLLDLAFVNDAAAFELLQSLNSLLPIDAPHLTFVLKLEICAHTPASESIDPVAEEFDFKRCNFETLNSRLEAVYWSTMDTAGSLDDAVTEFYDQLLNVLRDTVPVRARRFRCPSRTPPWWNSQLRNLRNQLRKAPANLFARFFETVHSSQDPTVPPEQLNELATYNINLPLLTVSVAEVKKALGSVDAAKGPVPNRICRQELLQLACPSRHKHFQPFALRRCFPVGVEGRLNYPDPQIGESRQS